MAKEENKIELERIYNIPLRKEWLKVPKYRRAAKAIKALKQFLAKHMKVEERDIRKVKIDKYLNEEIWFKGIKKPLAKVKVKAIKQDGIVTAELLEIPSIIQFKIDKEKKEDEKTKTEKEKKKAEQAAKETEEKKEDKEEKTEEEKKDEKEKVKSTVEAGLERQKQQAKQMKHAQAPKQQQKHQFRKALKK